MSIFGSFVSTIFGTIRIYMPNTPDTWTYRISELILARKLF